MRRSVARVPKLVFAFLLASSPWMAPASLGAGSTDPGQPPRLIGGEVGVWQFDPDNLNVPTAGYTQDASGNGLHAMMGSSAESDAQDPASRSTGGAPGYDGTTGSGYFSYNHGQYLQVSPSSLLDAGRITVTAWISVDPTNNLHHPFEDLVSKAGGADGFYTAVYTDSSDRQFLAAFIYGVGSDAWLIASSPLRENGWVAIALTYDGSSMALYIDGQQATLRTGLSGSVQPNSYPVTIGASPRDDRYFYGSIDEVRIYSRALGQTEIQDIQDAPYGTGGSSASCPTQSADSTTKALWRFESGAASMDSSGNGNTLTFYAGATSSGNALALSGAGQYASVPDSASLTLRDTLIVEACVRPASLNSGGGIAAQSGGPYGWQGAWYLMVLSTGQVRFWLSANGAADGGIETTTAPIAAGGTYRIRAEYVGSARTAQVFVNDQLQPATAPWAGGIPSRLFDSAQPVDMGTIRNSGNALGPYFAGTIDEVRIRGTTATPNRAPYIGSYPLPSNYATGVPWNPTLSWSGGDPDDGDSVTWTVHLGTSTSPAAVPGCTDLWGPTGASCTPGTLARGTSHYWRVVGTDSQGTTTTGPLWRFTTKANTAPAACMAAPTVQQATVFVNAQCSSDGDGDTLGFSWSWGDQTGAGTGPSASHTYGCFGPYVIALTVSDGYTTSTAQATVNPAGSFPHSDADGLEDCLEARQQTDPRDDDTDDDGLSDYVESNLDGHRWPTYSNIFCHPSQPSGCDSPNPTVPDVYVEVDWMQTPGNHWHDHALPDDVVKRAKTAFHNHGIELHVDQGAFGGGNQIPHDDRFESGSDDPTRPDDWDWYYNDLQGNGFTQARRGIYHYAVMAHEGGNGGEDCPYWDAHGVVGLGEIANDMFVLFRSCIDRFTMEWEEEDDNVLGIFLQELGHNLFGLIEPAADRFATDNAFHDKYEDYAMWPQMNGASDYHPNRWRSCGAGGGQSCDIDDVGKGLSGGPGASYRNKGEAGLMGPRGDHETCMDSYCVRLVPVGRLGDLYLASASEPSPLAQVHVETGTLWISGFGDSLELPLAVAYLGPSPVGAMTQSVGGLSTTYVTDGPVCVGTTCQYSLGTGPQISEEKVGELWSATLEIRQGSTDVLSLPILTLVRS